MARPSFLSPLTSVSHLTPPTSSCPTWPSHLLPPKAHSPTGTQGDWAKTYVRSLSAPPPPGLAAQHPIPLSTRSPSAQTMTKVPPEPCALAYKFFLNPKYLLESDRLPRSHVES